MSTDRECLKYAENVLTEDSNEAHLVRHIHNLLEYVWDTRCETQYYIYGQGVADLVCFDRKVLIEVKKPRSLASGGSRLEDAKQQLANYFAEWHHPEEWTAILTDGTIWYAWEANRILIDDPQTDKMASKEQLVAYVKRQGNLGNNTPPPPANTEDLVAIYLGLQEQLEDSLWPGLRESESTRTKLKLWDEMLRGSGMVIEDPEEQNKLFRNHTMLASVVRMVKANLISEVQAPHYILADGYWSWVVNSPEGEVWAAALKDKVDVFNWRQSETDIFRNFYEQVIDKKLRQNYGEYYTPDWLAQAICEEVLDEEWLDESIEKAINGEDLDGIGVLDPACGSGTFLYHASKRIQKHPRLANLRASTQTEVVAKLVYGIDVHPIAVEISQVTAIRSLPIPPSIPIRIFQGDSLGISKTGLTFHEDSLLGNIWRWDIGSDSFELPSTFIESDHFSDMLQPFVRTAVEGKPMPTFSKYDSDQDIELLSQGHAALSNIIKNKGDGVWAWYIGNTIGPRLLAKRKVNRIIANPPWVTMNKIRDTQRKLEFESVAKSTHIWPKGKYNTNFDIAALFPVICERSYLSENHHKQAGWITQASSKTSGQWADFRSIYSNRFPSWWDLSKVSQPPFETAPSSVWFVGVDQKEVQLRLIDKIERDYWQWNRTNVIFEPLPIHPNWFPSEYDLSGRNLYIGADIFPLVLVKVEAAVPCEDNTGMISIKTDKSSKGKWRYVPQREGIVPLSFLKPAIYKDDLLPFTLTSSLSRTIIPVDDGNNLASPPIEDPFWVSLEEVYENNKGTGKSNPSTLLDRIDYNGNVSRQLELSGIRIAYGRSGSYVRAAVIEDSDIIIYNSYAWIEVENIQEADYLCSILNCEGMQQTYELVKENPRSYQKHIWTKIPIPIYNDSKLHREISGVGREARRISTDYRNQLDPDSTKNQVNISKRIREQLLSVGLTEQINCLVKELLPGYCVSE